MSKHKERQFQIEIVQHLKTHGYVEGDASGYDRALALYRDDIIAYIQSTQPDAYKKMHKREGTKTDDVLCKLVAKSMDSRGSLYCLRNEVTHIGTKFKLCQFKPELANATTQAKYDANILRVVQEVTTKSGKERIDLVLFLNGIPVVTMELKTDFTQNVQDAINQYKYDRPAKGDPLLEFKRRSLVHFALSNDEVYMTTKLAGPSTFFLPFNKGTADGSQGNPPNENGYATSYLWEDVLARHSLLNIIARYIHLEVKDKENNKGHKSRSETLIFPRYHQLDVVRKLLADSKTNGAGKNYLIQHSAGSGKSNSIAWLAHQLSSLHSDNEQAVFNSVIVITDRTVLDSQLQETIASFEHKEGVVVGISREGNNESKSAQLADALERGAKIIITTIQTFPFVLEAIQKRTTLKENNYAIIADEAHSSQTGSTAKQLKEVLSAQQIEEGVELTAEDVIAAQITAYAGKKNLSYYAFTATPKVKTLEMFGVLPKPDEAPSETNKPEAFHLYTMKQAIQERFILDVLQGYTTYKEYYELEHKRPHLDEEVESKRAKVLIAKWLNIHPSNISQKIEIICAHFLEKVAHLLDRQAKAMVVTSSRKAAVRYKIAFDAYIKKHQIEDKMKVMVAFSGTISDDIEGKYKEYTESNMNPDLKGGMDMRKAFDTNEYQVMLVANKFQTGFDQPKLCAMYVDKKLGGVDCVQTLSRLNRIYPNKTQTFILDFVNAPKDIQAAFEPYYNSTALKDVTDPNLVHELQLKLEASNLFSTLDIKRYAKAYFDPKGTQAAMSSAIKPTVDRYKNQYRDCLMKIQHAKQSLKRAKSHNDERLIKNSEVDLKTLGETKSELDIFKKDLVSFLHRYEFLSQIVNYESEELIKLAAFVKALIPNLKTNETKDPINIADVVLAHYQLHQQENTHMTLVGQEELTATIGGGASAKDPEEEFLSQIIAQINDLFKNDHAHNYVFGIIDKIKEDTHTMDQMKNNSKEQAMEGGFKEAMKTAVIETLDEHQNMATQVLGLGNEKVCQAVANIVYEFIANNHNIRVEGLKGNQAEV